jgi:hypothetical protein
MTVSIRRWLRYQRRRWCAWRGHRQAPWSPIVITWCDSDVLNADGSITRGAETRIRAYRCSIHDPQEAPCSRS